MAAWMGTSNSWRGMFSFSFSHSRRARGYALSRWAMKLRASTAVAVEQQVHLHQIAGAVAGQLVVQAGVALGVGLQRVEEVVDDLVQGHLIVQLHQVGVQILHVLELAPAVLAHGHDVAHIVLGS